MSFMSEDIKKVFPLPFRGELVDDGVFKLLAPFEYNNPPIRIIIPANFVSDGASIPWWAYSIIGGRWTGKYVRSALIHDYSYYEQLFPRKKCDVIFIDGMGILGVDWWRKKSMYRAVRVGAMQPWNKYKRRKEKENA